ncbi:hypothetical protein WA158_006715 [Blastocystis sp. Blastoise]
MEPENLYIKGEKLTITPLGAGREVGRSCILLTFKEKNILFDCGIHPSYEGEDALPFLTTIDVSTIDLVLISHFHLDHCAALPYLTELHDFKGRVFATGPTKGVMKMLLKDYIHVSNTDDTQPLYTDADLSKSVKRIEEIDFHEEKWHNSIKVTAYQAGHVLGAAMFLVEIDGVRILYTGDFSCVEDRHLSAAEIPPVSIDILICESTYGIENHLDRNEREAEFTSTVHNIVKKKGNVLLPTFALGRAQELLLLLDEYWESHPELKYVPVYYCSSMAEKALKIFKLYLNMMNKHIQQRALTEDPFKFKHIENLARIDSDVSYRRNPAVIICSPGMLQNGVSRQLLEEWAPGKDNAVILTGYTVKGTMADHIRGSDVKTIEPLSNGAPIDFRCAVYYMSFSAHSDYKGTSGLIEKTKVNTVILVHGEANKMLSLQNKLLSDFEQKNTNGVFTVDRPNFSNPFEKIFQSVKTAKVMGLLARGDTLISTSIPAGLMDPSLSVKREISDSLNIPTGDSTEENEERKKKRNKETDNEEEEIQLSLQDGNDIHGILVEKEYNYQIIHPDEISEYTKIWKGQLVFKQTVAFTTPIPILINILKGVFKQVEMDKMNLITINNSIQMTPHFTPNSPVITAVIEWVGSRDIDIYVDTLISIIYQCEVNKQIGAIYPILETAVENTSSSSPTPSSTTITTTASPTTITTSSSPAITPSSTTKDTMIIEPDEKIKSENQNIDINIDMKLESNCEPSEENTILNMKTQTYNELILKKNLIEEQFGPIEESDNIWTIHLPTGDDLLINYITWDIQCSKETVVSKIQKILQNCQMLSPA